MLEGVSRNEGIKNKRVGERLWAVFEIAGGKVKRGVKFERKDERNSVIYKHKQGTVEPSTGMEDSMQDSKHDALNITITFNKPILTNNKFNKVNIRVGVIIVKK